MHRAACLIALLHRACALKDLVFQGALTPEAIDRIRKGERFNQKLSNSDDVQYFGDMFIGGQVLTGIMDTGSFELVTFEKNCATCGKAGKYDRSKSSTWKRGKQEKVHSYGSGDCNCQDGYDKVDLGGTDIPIPDRLGADNEHLWVATQCRMPLLASASFNAIVGIGPPGQPEFSAREKVKRAKGEVDKGKDKAEDQVDKVGDVVPGGVAQQQQQQRQQQQQQQHGDAGNMGKPDKDPVGDIVPGSGGKDDGGDVAPRALNPDLDKAEKELHDCEGQKDLLENLKVLLFSQCLDKKAGGPGWLVWNDQAPVNAMKVKVKGDITWSSSLADWSMGNTVVGCKTGCAALVDTGTSLFAVPTPIYDEMERELDKINGDCSDLSGFPDLKMVIDGNQLRFPPQSYLGQLYGSMNKEVERFMRPRNKSMSFNRGTANNCELLVMDLGNSRDTKLGPMVIMGMPFFRTYYTTFDLANGYRSDGVDRTKDDTGRKIWLVDNTPGKCGPPGPSMLNKDQEASNVNVPLRIDAAKLRVPAWMDHWRHGI